MTKIKEINLVSQVPDLIFPVLWADENAELDEVRKFQKSKYDIF